MKKIRIGLIGFGNRGRLYCSFLKDLKDECELVAIYDYKLDFIRKDAEKYHAKYLFGTEDEFFDAKLDLDLVVISSMDKYHFVQTKRCLEAGYHVLLEKPIATKLEEVIEINELAKKLQRNVYVCHVLRYTMFYSLVKEIIDSGEIGEVVNINTTENVAYWHQAHSFTRGNWHNSKETAPMILTKCSHDLDLIYWLMNKKPIRVSSFGSLFYLNAEHCPEGAADYCTDCKLKDECAFNAYRFYHNNPSWIIPFVGEDINDEKIDKFLDHGAYSRCVYKCDNDVVDHQVVNIEFENHATASHTMNAYTRDCYRDIKVMGTKGQIQGSFEEQKFKVYHFLNNEEREIDIKKMTDNFVGHGGGDPLMFKEVVEHLLYGKKTASLTLLNDSVVSHIVAFSAEKSRIENGKVIDIKL